MNLLSAVHHGVRNRLLVDLNCKQSAKYISGYSYLWNHSLYPYMHIFHYPSMVVLYKTAPASQRMEPRHQDSPGRMSNGTDPHRLPLPNWWKVPNSEDFPICSVLFRLLCLISVGRYSLDYHWNSKVDEGEWDKHRKMVVKRLNNINIVTSLVALSAVRT
ncbi:uncharacterized protein EDB91DRAFT_1166104 [Suillus paluster]|uniref:uncharacterized protein n=1 Tax=Suillus paluster TaxID=48578 RepID=UPI001B868471|nr:uncharacterized protein EDB91DRAFT_1166104 [Suillus paluster]KAG1726498.1 hypothetical protein EDB91DRAFT_1166104 [Suillus paluster]